MPTCGLLTCPPARALFPGCLQDVGQYQGALEHAAPLDQAGLVADVDELGRQRLPVDLGGHALVPLLERRTLNIAARAESVSAAPGFQLIATVTSAPGQPGFAAEAGQCFEPLDCGTGSTFHWHSPSGVLLLLILPQGALPRGPTAAARW